MFTTKFTIVKGPFDIDSILYFIDKKLHCCGQSLQCPDVVINTTSLYI